MKATQPKPNVSQENHIMLVQLNDAVTSLSKQVGNHISEQQDENIRLHQRIDTVQNETRKGVDEIKSSLANTGKVSSGQIFSLIAVLISVLAFFGGLAQAYLSVRLGNITPLIEHNSDALTVTREELRQVRAELVDSRIENARQAATSAEAQRWLEKNLDQAGPHPKPNHTAP